MHDQIVRRDDAFERAPSRGRIRVKDAVSAPLRSMLVDALPERLEILAATLAAAGHRIVACLSAGADLHSDVIKIDPDVVIIEIDAPDREILEDMHAIHRETPRPIIVFTQDQDPSLNYWLAAQGIDPLRAVHTRTVRRRRWSVIGSAIESMVTARASPGMHSQSPWVSDLP